jgi:hypothetical protein
MKGIYFIAFLKLKLELQLLVWATSTQLPYEPPFFQDQCRAMLGLIDKISFV